MKGWSLILLLFLSSFIYSQETLKVTGYVTDSSNFSPLYPVTIKAKNSRSFALTDSLGYFEIAITSIPDTLTFAIMGYESRQIIVNPTDSIEKQLFVGMVESASSLNIVTVKPGENPAFKVLRKVRENSVNNDPDELNSYECEVYTKMQFDINNMSDKFEDRKLLQKFDFVMEYLDSSDSEKYLPVFLTENVSDYYARNHPTQRMEQVKGVRMTGIDYLQFESLTGELHTNANIYDNYISLFNKEFMSPIADGGRAFYKYYLSYDTLDAVPCYKIKFVPRRKGDLVFEGNIWIVEEVYAVRRVEASIPNWINLNYVSDFTVVQDFKQVESGHWMLYEERITAHFNLFNEMKKNRLMGVTVHKSALRKNYVINKDRGFDFYVADIQMADSAKNRTEDFWDEMRHEPLNSEEQGIVDMMDTLKQTRAYRFLENAAYMGWSGFWRAGPVEIGSIYSLYNRNVVEGHRWMMALRTSNKFSTKVELNAFLIYGFNDQVWKYGGSARWKIKNRPREMLRVGYRKRIEQLGLSSSVGDIGNSFTTLLSLGPLDKLTMVELGSFSYEKDWKFDMRTFNSFEWMKFTPIGVSDYRKYDPVLDDTINVTSLTSFQIRNQIMFTKEEKFLNGQFDRYSLGSKYPIVSLTHTWGIKDVLNSEHNFHRLDFILDHRPRLGMFGRLQYSIYAGKVFGTVPYPFLQVHQGNETFYLQTSTPNMMYYYEFISDEWVGANFEHHLQGFIMDRIPLIRRLKLRLVYGAKMVVGRYNDKHNSELILPFYSNKLSSPYYEASVGLENIFKFIRVDALWRLSYRDNLDLYGNQVRNFGVKFAFTYDF